MAFSLVEVLVAAAILAILAGLIVSILPEIRKNNDRTAMATTMREFGRSMASYSLDHNNRFVGPLWPGQVAEFDRTRGGRLVVLLAPYLGIEDKPQPYVVNKLLTASLRQATSGIPSKHVRLFVMNTAVPGESGPLNPWGREQNNPTQSTPPLLRSQLPPNSGTLPAMSEADRTHPAVVSAPWASNTAPRPPHGEPRLVLRFDGSVGGEN
ncbi:MAG: hypothetical protein Fur0032_24900 [Terrimicrobiaceae bacterium]